MGAHKTILLLQDKTSYAGIQFGSQKTTSGEVVFLTGMVGYTEALTDPSFAGQILVFTYPLIGNYGVDISRETLEGKKIWAAGVVVSSVYSDTEHATANMSFSEWLKREGVPGVAGVDTRALAEKIRDMGTQLAKIGPNPADVSWYDPNAENIVARVSCEKPYTVGTGRKRVTLIDCGAKNNIVRELAKRDCTVTVVPWDYPVSRENVDGLFISNGPGDPTVCKETIHTIRNFMAYNKPVFGICLGNQLLALAAGGKTAKLPFGHRSQNQPCVDETTGRVYITTQNHGFHVKTSTLPKEWKPWFTNVNDGTNEGIRHRNKPFMSVQFHPEARPGPTDTNWLFDYFVKQL